MFLLHMCFKGKKLIKSTCIDNLLVIILAIFHNNINLALSTYIIFISLFYTHIYLSFIIFIIFLTYIILLAIKLQHCIYRYIQCCNLSQQCIIINV